MQSVIIIISYAYIFKYTYTHTRQQVQNGVTYAKLYLTKPRLNYSFQKWNLKPVNHVSPDQH